mmetsp:Transcript_33457/g.36000  ORF Transcript_33457/g.36000 Transcript_33457/m.36000 type:complete len:783 (+) Transcript_33457:98-2446(+)
MQNNFLWSEEDIDVSKDGFLLFKHSKEENLDDEDQPLLLHSSTRVLRSLYPSLSMDEIFQHSGYSDEMIWSDSVDEIAMKCQIMDDEKRTIQLTVNEENENRQLNDDNEDDVNNEIKTKKASIPIEYRSYQNLVRTEDLANLIQSALKDTINFRHRSNNRSNSSYSYASNEEVKVRALKHQQQRLLQENLECSNAAFRQDDIGDRFEKESTTIKLVRTINSIRALFPHLLPILNHPRQNDKHLVIGKTRYKTKRNGANMCWLLGTTSFSTTTRKMSMAVSKDAKRILESFIDAKLAKEICKERKGSPTFWSRVWIEHIIKRSNPPILSPLKILSVSCGKSEKEIERRAHICDKNIYARQQAAGQSMDQQYQISVSKIHRRLSDVLTSRFYGARLSIYGSCLSKLSIGKGSDVDISLWIPEADTLKRCFHDGTIEAWRYNQEMTKLVHQVFRKLNNFRAEFRGMSPITKARIPVITGTYIYAGNPFTEDGSINFDICFVNDIAVANSNLLWEYSMVDSRVRSLMISVKQFANEHKINSAKNKCISSYTWMNLVIFYLQCIGFIPNLQSPALAKAVGITSEPEKYYWHFVNRLDTFFLRWEIVKNANIWVMPGEFDDMPLSVLLYGLFEFYSSRFPFGTHAVSIKKGDISLSKLTTRKVGVFFSIEDPFETYDSYCPHDLGTPVNEYASEKIRECLYEAEDHLKNLLCFDKHIDEGLWPEPKFVNPEPTNRNARKSVFKRFQLPLLIYNDARGEKPTIGSGGNQNTPKKLPHDGMHRSQNDNRG